MPLGAPQGRCPTEGPFAPARVSNAGVSQLSDLTIGVVCGDPNGPIESKPCEGAIKVEETSGVDSNLWWLFDATTGALEAYGEVQGPGAGLGCEGARPGFVFPYQCYIDGWSGATSLCTDAAPPSGCLDGW